MDVLKNWLWGKFTFRKRRFEKAIKDGNILKALDLIIIPKDAKKEIIREYLNSVATNG